MYGHQSGRPSTETTSTAHRTEGPPIRAVDGLDLSVAGGEVHGFLGPNGAGKSTTMRVLLGLLKVDAGRIYLLREAVVGKRKPVAKAA